MPWGEKCWDQAAPGLLCWLNPTDAGRIATGAAGGNRHRIRSGLFESVRSMKRDERIKRVQEIFGVHVCVCVQFCFQMFSVLFAAQPDISTFPEKLVIEAQILSDCLSLFATVWGFDTIHLPVQGSSYDKLDGMYRSVGWVAPKCEQLHMVCEELHTRTRIPPSLRIVCTLCIIVRMAMIMVITATLTIMIKVNTYYIFWWYMIYSVTVHTLKHRTGYVHNHGQDLFSLYIHIHSIIFYMHHPEWHQNIGSLLLPPGSCPSQAGGGTEVGVFLVMIPTVIRWSETRVGYAADMLKICWRYAEDMLKICWRYACIWMKYRKFSREGPPTAR